MYSIPDRPTRLRVVVAEVAVKVNVSEVQVAGSGSPLPEVNVADVPAAAAVIFTGPLKSPEPSP
jgi:hypothetical protein